MGRGDAIGDALKVATAYYGVDPADVLSARRSARVHEARCMGMFLAQRAGADVHQIGRRFGGRDPSIVAAVCRNMFCKTASNRRLRVLARKLEVLRKAETSQRRDRPGNAE